MAIAKNGKAMHAEKKARYAEKESAMRPECSITPKAVDKPVAASSAFALKRSETIVDIARPSPVIPEFNEK
jgi:hypothetical protein